MKIAIIGSGAVGGYFGGVLAKAGYTVSFLARGKHLAAMKKNGLTVKSILSDFHINMVTATDSIAALGKPDLVILGVKAWQIKEIRNHLKTIIQPHTLILPLENGISAAEELAEVIKAAHILGGLCRIISDLESPGVIRHSGLTPTIVFGELDKSHSKRIEKLKEVFTAAGIHSIVSHDIESELWKKFMMICVSGLLALTRTTYGELRQLKETRQMMIDCIDEVYALSQKIGVAMESGSIGKIAVSIDSFPSDAISSLTRDVCAGRPSEIEYQNGTVVRLGKKYGVPTPVNSFIYTCILPMELKARKSAMRS